MKIVAVILLILAISAQAADLKTYQDTFETEMLKIDMAHIEKTKGVSENSSQMKKLELVRASKIAALVRKFGGALSKLQKSLASKGDKAGADEVAAEKEKVSTGKDYLAAKELIEKENARIKEVKKVAAAERAAAKKKADKLKGRGKGSPDGITPQQEFDHMYKVSSIRDMHFTKEYHAFLFGVSYVRGGPYEYFSKVAMSVEFIDDTGKKWFAKRVELHEGKYRYKPLATNGIIVFFLPAEAQNPRVKAYCILAGAHHEPIMASEWYGFEDYSSWLKEKGREEIAEKDFQMAFKDSNKFDMTRAKVKAYVNKIKR